MSLVTEEDLIMKWKDERHEETTPSPGHGVVGGNSEVGTRIGGDVCYCDYVWVDFETILFRSFAIWKNV